MYTGPNIVREGLILHLDAANRKSYVNGTTVWNDLSGRGNNGTLINGPTFSSANGGSIVFDGANDYSLVSNKFMTGLTSFTFESWVYATDTFGGTVCCYNIPTLHSGPQFTFSPIGIGLIVYNTNGSNFISNNSIALTNSLNTWYHIVCTWIPGVIRLYLNTANVTGNNSTLGSVPTSVIGDAQGQITEFRIGTGLTSQDSYFKGSVSNIKVYNRVLSQTEVIQNYNATKGRFNL